MTQRTLRKEIEDKVAAWAANQNIQIAYENVPFTKPNKNDEDAFIEFYIIPTVTVNPTVDTKRTTLIGLLQFNIYTKSGKGTKKSEDLAQALINLFPVYPKTGTVSIESVGYTMNPLYDAQWRVLPVRFKYRQENYS